MMPPKEISVVIVDMCEDKPLIDIEDDESIQERKFEQRSVLSYHNSNLKRTLSNNNSRHRRVMNFNRRNTRNNIKGFNRLIQE